MNIEKLKQWIKTLTNEQKDKIILDLVEFGVDSEYISFWESSKEPIYSNNGERLCGTPHEEDDECN